MRLLLLFGLLASTALAAGPDAGRRPRVAVLYFEVHSTNADLQVFTKGLAELMIDDLVQSGTVDVVERARLEDVMAELKLGETRFADKAAFARAGALLGADYLVVGSIIGNKDLRLTARVIATDRGLVPKSSRVVLSGDDVFEAEERLVADVVQQLVSLGAIAAAPPATRRGHKLPLSTATRFARALDAKDKKDQATAVKLLTEVVAEQPQFKLAQLDLLSLTQ